MNITKERFERIDLSLPFSYKELSWIETFANMSLLMKQHSNCSRLKVGSILTKENRIISTGYNGTPSGIINCNEHFTDADRKSLDFYDKHGEFSKKYEIHAEVNCIIFAQKVGISVVDCEMFVTTEPCYDCAKFLVGSGIKRIFFIDKYDRGYSGQEILQYCGIPVYHLKGPQFSYDGPMLELNE